jgi:hypothetical protein
MGLEGGSLIALDEADGAVAEAGASEAAPEAALRLARGGGDDPFAQEGLPAELGQGWKSPSG